MSRKCIWLMVLAVISVCFAGMAHGQTVYINFQSTSQGDGAIPEGYLPDYGEEFGDRGNGWTYGWDQNMTGQSRDRDNAIAPDQRYDTTNHIGRQSATWEIELENGVYDLFVVGGDSNHTDQVNNFDIEGVIVEDPDGQDNFDEYELTVTVADGRLTIMSAEGQSNAKIMFVDIILAIAPESARSPSPTNEATDIPRDMTLAWEPGEGATAHDVYLGASLEDVNTASRANPKDVLLSQGQSGLEFDAPRLEFGLTYYWRIDEVLAGGVIFQGEPWSFTVEPFAYAVEGVTVTASTTSDPDAGPERTIDGSGLDETDGHSVANSDMWVGLPVGADPVSLEYDLGQVYKLHEMLVWNYNVQFEPVLGFGLKNVTIEYSADGAEWTVLGDVELNQATAQAGYAANTTVAFGGVAVKLVKITVNSNFGGLAQYGLSEVRFLQIPATARQPEPAADATDVSVATMLTWRAGREAASHDVYLGTDADALALAGSAEAASYNPGVLDLSTAYSWKVDEVNEAEAIGIWEGGIWSFTTQEFLVVDDFESYVDDEGGRIYESWVDGYGVPSNGSQVGHLESPFAEQTIVKGGSQSMPLFYDNSGTSMSEAELTLAQNWTASGIKGLTLSFHGDADNTGGQLYVKINGTKVPYDGAASKISSAGWNLWSIDLATVGNVSNVTSLIIGIEGAGASGVLYIDDVQLHPEVLDYHRDADITAGGDTVQGVPNDGDWPDAETPDLAVDDDVNTKFLHRQGGAMATGIQITPAVGSTVVTGLTLTTANDAPARDPITFELSGSNAGIDGPYTLIAAGDVVDFAGTADWPRFTKNSTVIAFDNDVAYTHYQIVFPTLRGESETLMQIAEIELIGE